MLPSSYSLHQRIGLVAGLFLFGLIRIWPAPASLSEQGWQVAATASLMVTWWLTEALPLPVTALLPMVLFPIGNVMNIHEVTAAYADPVIFLFLGGFILARAMQQTGLPKRLALTIIWHTGTETRAIIIGFMLATAFISMWVSNTATALMMLPIGLSIIQLLEKQGPDHKKLQSNFATVLMLTIAYASSVGGMGTLIGTPPNALLAAFMRQNYNVHISFVEWMIVGIPVVSLGLVLVYWTLTRIVFPIASVDLIESRKIIQQAYTKLGPMSKAEKRVCLLFVITALLWIGRPVLALVIPGLTDASIAMLAVVLLFLFPVNWREGKFVLSWQVAEQLPWGVLILFGGGIALSIAINHSGLANWISSAWTAFNRWPSWLVLLLVIVYIVILTEIASNTAITATFLPIVAALALAMGKEPILYTLPMTLAANCAFMMPIATPPNAVVYGSQLVSMRSMLRAGLVLNILFVLFIFILSHTLIDWWFG